jgi:hypothetical protein
MPRVPIQIGSRLFSSKSEAKSFAREILNRSGDGEIISGPDDVFLRDLIAIHHDAATKIGCGIAHFTVRPDPNWGTTRHFVITRTDGSDTDFSFHVCIDGSNQRRDVFHAFRHAVAPQILEFQQGAFTGDLLPICCYTQAILTPADAHVDHAPPDTFLTLAMKWMAQEELLISDVPLVDNADNQWVREMRDPRQQASWQAFHRQHAKLRIISREGNLSHAKRAASN